MRTFTRQRPRRNTCSMSATEGLVRNLRRAHPRPRSTPRWGHAVHSHPIQRLHQAGTGKAGLADMPAFPEVRDYLVVVDGLALQKQVVPLLQCVAPLPTAAAALHRGRENRVGLRGLFAAQESRQSAWRVVMDRKACATGIGAYLSGCSWPRSATSRRLRPVNLALRNALLGSRYDTRVLSHVRTNRLGGTCLANGGCVSCVAQSPCVPTEIDGLVLQNPPSLGRSA